MYSVQASVTQHDAACGYILSSMWVVTPGIPRGMNENQNLISTVKQYIIIALLVNMCVLTQEYPKWICRWSPLYLWQYYSMYSEYCIRLKSNFCPHNRFTRPLASHLNKVAVLASTRVQYVGSYSVNNVRTNISKGDHIIWYSSTVLSTV
jgi:hypothetical protein